MKKLVLAYSGGLDTSYCAVYFSKDLGHEVHAVSVNTGGFTQNEINEIEKKAYQMGVKTYQNINALETYYQKVVKYLIYGNVLKNNMLIYFSKCQFATVDGNKYPVTTESCAMIRRPLNF